MMRFLVDRFLRVFGFLSRINAGAEDFLRKILPHRHQTLFLLTAVCLFGLLLRLLLLYLEPMISPDSIFYLDAAEEWSEHGMNGLLASKRGFAIPLLLLFLLKLVHNCGLPYETSGLIVNIFFGVALMPLFYFTSLWIFNDRRTALFAALLAAIHPSLIEYSTDILRETPMIFFMLLVLFFIACAERTERPILWIPAGFFATAACLTRYEALELIPLVFFYLLICFFFGGKKYARSKALKKALFWLCGMCAGAVFFYFLFDAPASFYSETYFHKIKAIKYFRFL